MKSTLNKPSVSTIGATAWKQLHVQINWYLLTKSIIDKRWSSSLSLMIFYLRIFSYTILQRIHWPEITTTHWKSSSHPTVWQTSSMKTLLIWLIIWFKPYFNKSLFPHLCFTPSGSILEWMTSPYRFLYRKWHCLSCLIAYAAFK